MRFTIICCFVALTVAGCTPTVKLEAPDKPIEINMNVKIQQEVRVKLERDVQKEITANPELFGLPSATKGTKK